MTAKVALLLELPDRLVAQYLLTLGIFGNHDASLLIAHVHGRVPGRPAQEADGGPAQDRKTLVPGTSARGRCPRSRASVGGSTQPSGARDVTIPSRPRRPRDTAVRPVLAAAKHRAGRTGQLFRRRRDRGPAGELRHGRPGSGLPNGPRLEAVRRRGPERGGVR